VSNIKLNVSDWKISLKERSRGRMKINIKLNKDEAEGFKNWSETVKPDNINTEELIH